MKATLEFILPEEEPEFRLAQNGGRYSSVLDDIYNIARSELKHGLATQESLLQTLERIKAIAAGALFDDN